LHSLSPSSDLRFRGTRGSRGIPAPRPTPISTLSIHYLHCLWYGIFLWVTLGQLPGRAPSQLLHTCSLAEHGKLKKVLDFLATTENVRVLSRFFSHSMQNTAATGKKVNSVPAKTRPDGNAGK